MRIVEYFSENYKETTNFEFVIEDDEHYSVARIATLAADDISIAEGDEHFR